MSSKLDEAYKAALRDAKKGRSPRSQNIVDDLDDDLDDEIIEGMARVVFADAWAQEEEEKGESFGGMDIYEIAPETPDYAVKWARAQAKEILRMNPKLPSLTRLYKVSKKAGYKRDAESFGASLGLQITGSGAGITDDMSVEASRMIRDAFDFPYSEFYLD